MVKKYKKAKKKSIKSILYKNIYIDTPYRVVLGILTIIILTAITSVAFRYGVKLETINSLYYTEKSNLDYNVYLKPNDYFEEQFLGKDRQYVASLIDYISADFKYELNASDPFDYTYDYWITATLIAKEKTDKAKVVYEKEFPLLSKKDFKFKDSNNFYISENVKIDYAYYNEIINNFKKSYGLSLDSNLIVKMYVTMNGKEKSIKQDINSNQVMEVNIPLSEQTININMDYKEINDSKIVEEVSNTEIINYTLFVICIIALILDLIVVVRFVRFLEKIKNPSTEYNKKLHRILKEYDRAIVKTRRLPDIKDLKLIEVASFEELLDARDNLEEPILYIDITPNQKSCFLIINQKQVYKFVLKAADLDLFKKQKKKNN